MQADEAIKFAKDNQMEYIETSAKTGINIEKAYTFAGQRILDRIEKGEIDVLDEKSGIKPGLHNNKISHELSTIEKPKRGSECC